MLTALTNFPMPIITPRLILRKPEPSHEDCLQYSEAVTESINELSKWLPWAKELPSLMQTHDYLKSCDLNWALKTNNNFGLVVWIIEKNTGLLIGSMTMWNILWSIPKFEFGYWARTSKTNNGYITEAVNALTHYCFQALGVNRIEIRCEIKNTRAQLIPKRLGYNLDGILRNSTRAVADKTLTDTILFSCTDPTSLPKIEISY